MNRLDSLCGLKVKFWDDFSTKNSSICESWAKFKIDENFDLFSFFSVSPPALALFLDLEFQKKKCYLFGNVYLDKSREVLY